MLNYTMPPPPAMSGQVGQTGAMPPMTQNPSGPVAGNMAIQPGAIGGGSLNPIYGPGGIGTSADGSYMPGWGPNGQIPGYSNSIRDQLGMQLPPPPAGAPMGPQNPNAVMPPPPGMAPGMPPKTGSNNPYSPHAPVANVPAPGMPGLPGAPNMTGYADGTQFGGQTTVNPQAAPADYNSVRGFADQAYQQSMRNLQPQMDSQNRRFDQQLINQGLDPSSEAGRLAADQLARNQNDLQSKAAFDALQFGQGIQNQMFGQDLQRSQLAGQMQMGDWANNTAMNNIRAGIYGDQLGFKSNANAQEVAKYQSQLAHQLGMGNLDLSRQQQDWNEYNDLEGMNQWQANFNRTGDWRNQDLMLAMMGMGNQMPGGGVNGNIGVGAGASASPAQIWGDTFGQQWDKWNTRGGA